MKHKYRKGAAIKPKFNLGAMLKKYIDGGMLENGTNASGYNTTVLGGQYTSDSPYGDKEEERFLKVTSTPLDSKESSTTDLNTSWISIQA